MKVDELPIHWFPAKKYGWGWGLPTRWQGWLTMFVLFGSMITNAILFEPASHPLEFFSGVGVLSVAVLVVCYLKGAPPAWRWGKE